MGLMFDSDYLEYRGHPADPRYDDSEDVARDKWECEETYIAKLGPDAVEEIMWALQFGEAEDAKDDLIKAINAAWEQYKTENEGDSDEPDTLD
jgi:hypothetical protein